MTNLTQVCCRLRTGVLISTIRELHVVAVPHYLYLLLDGIFVFVI